MTYDEGMNVARKLIKKEPHLVLPENLADDLLRLLIQCSQEEESPHVALPLMLILHLWRYEPKTQEPSVFNELKKKFYIYRKLCIEEYRSRHLNIIPFQSLEGST